MEPTSGTKSEAIHLAIEHIWLLIEHGSQEMIDWLRAGSAPLDTRTRVIAQFTVIICEILLKDMKVPEHGGRKIRLHLDPVLEPEEKPRYQFMRKDARGQNRWTVRNCGTLAAARGALERGQREEYTVIDASAQVDHALEVRLAKLKDVATLRRYPDPTVIQAPMERMSVVDLAAPADVEPIEGDGLYIPEETAAPRGWKRVKRIISAREPCNQSARALDREAMYSALATAELAPLSVDLAPGRLVVRCVCNCDDAVVVDAPEWFYADVVKMVAGKEPNEGSHDMLESLVNRLIDMHKWAHELATLLISRAEWDLEDLATVRSRTVRLDDLVQVHVLVEQPGFLGSAARN